VTSLVDRLLVAHGSHTGRQRDQNEDRVIVDAARGLFGVIDGVGGHPGGEHASELAAEQLTARLRRETGSPAERLREAITLANNAILEAAGREASLQGMTCVLTAVLVAGTRLTVGHVGDTRLYKIRHGEIRKLTRDHSPVGEREDAGELTETEAMRHPRRNEVYRDVGAIAHAPDDGEFVDIVEDTFEPDAAVVICSDGLSDQVGSPTIRASVEAHAGEPARSVDALIAAANEAGGKDNVSVVVVEGPAFAAWVRSSARGRGAAVAGGLSGSDRWGRAWPRRRDVLVFAAGVVLGLLLAAAAEWWLRVEWPRAPVGPPPEVTPLTRDPRTWRVGLTGDADAASIADALGQARAGDTVRLSPGDYREAVVLREAVTIEGPRDAVIRPPLGAAPGWTAVTVADTQGARLEGFTIAAADGQTIAVGVQAERCELILSDLVVSGASDAGIVAGEGATVRVTSSALHDNRGTGIVASTGSRLAIHHTTVLRNGAGPGRPRPGILLERGADVTLTGSAVGDNGGGAIVGWPPERLDALVRDNLVRPVPRAARGPGAPPRARPPALGPQR
jgi:serine/threonine protein phosphatase PrpC